MVDDNYLKMAVGVLAWTNAARVAPRLALPPGSAYVIPNEDDAHAARLAPRLAR